MLLGMLGRKTQLLNVDDDQPAVLHIYEDRKGSPTPKRKRESLLERDQEERRLGNLIFGEKYAIPDYQSVGYNVQCILVFFSYLVYPGQWR